jgi:hypothetical protein
MHAAVTNFRRENVTRGRQEPGTFEAALVMILETVDERLGMLDANADGKGLLLEPDVLRREEPIDVAGRVTGRENDSVSGEFLAAVDDDAAWRFYGDGGGVVEIPVAVDKLPCV